jgi:hypothetical protein
MSNAPPPILEAGDGTPSLPTMSSGAPTAREIEAFHDRCRNPARDVRDHL